MRLRPVMGIIAAAFVGAFAVWYFGISGRIETVPEDYVLAVPGMH